MNSRFAFPSPLVSTFALLVRTALIGGALLCGPVACGSQADSANMPTETGNPPVIDDSAIRLSFEEGSVRVEGAAGAVDPEAKVMVENSRTGQSESTSADTSGAFVVEIEGEVGDVISIHVSTGDGSTSVELTNSTPSQGADGGAPPFGPSPNDDSESSDATVTTASTNCEAGASSTLLVSPANNYRYASELSTTLASVNAGVDITFDWSELTLDTLGRPADVAMVTLFLVSLPAPDAVASLHEGTLSAEQLVAVLTYAPAGESSAKLTEFSVFGGEISDGDVEPYFEPDVYPKDEYTYVLAASSTTTFGFDFIAYQPFQLFEDAGIDSVALSDESLALTYSVDLSMLSPLSLPSEMNEVELQWALDVDAHGRAFDSTRIDRLTIARYDTMSRGELQDAFFDMEALADALWSAEATSGAGVRLKDFTDAGGNPLPVLTQGDSWVLAAHCATCPERAPVVVTFLEACTL